jgi:hypothetical protein
MPAFRVHAPVEGTASVLVEARDEEEAKRLAAQARLQDWSYDEWAPVKDPAKMAVLEEADEPLPIDWEITPAPDLGK